MFKKLKFKYSCTLIAILVFSVIVNAELSKAKKHGELSLLALGKTDKAMNWHGYTEIYEHIFNPLKNSPIKICEIGIEEGGSLILWRDYFPKATIYGIDILDKSILNSKRVKTFVADQANREQLKSFIDKNGDNFDIILDDGGHTMEQQQISFGYLFNYLKPGGYYIIEDVHTSIPFYRPGFGVEEDKKNTTLLMINRFIRYARIISKYLTPEEKAYLNDSIEYCNLFFRNNPRHSIACIFKKKNE
jgi:hypothetical protein